MTEETAYKAKEILDIQSRLSLIKIAIPFEVEKQLKSLQTQEYYEIKGESLKFNLQCVIDDYINELGKELEAL